MRAGIPNFASILRYERPQSVALPSQADASKLSGTSIESERQFAPPFCSTMCAALLRNVRSTLR
jgi:hypothetical protein